VRGKLRLFCASNVYSNGNSLSLIPSDRQEPAITFSSLHACADYKWVASSALRISAVKNSIISNKLSTDRSTTIVSWPKEQQTGIETYSRSRRECLPDLPSANRFRGCIDRYSPIVSSSIWYLSICEVTDRPGEAVGPTGVSGHVSGVHLDVIVTLQSPVGIIHTLDRSRKDVERDGALVRRDWSGFQLSAPGIRKSDGTIRRSGGVRDDFTERGEREIEFRCDRFEEFSVDIDHFSDRAEKIWVNGGW